MPNTSSAKKALKKNARRRARNRTQRSMLRTLVKKCRQAAGTEQADDAFRLAVKRLDQAAAKRLIHPNKAARTKSRLSKFLKESKGVGSASPAVAETPAAETPAAEAPAPEATAPETRDAGDTEASPQPE